MSLTIPWYTFTILTTYLLDVRIKICASYLCVCICYANDILCCTEIQRFVQTKPSCMNYYIIEYDNITKVEFQRGSTFLRFSSAMN